MGVLTPSARRGGAQRMFAMTLLLLEAFVAFFGALVAFGLQRGSGTTALVISAVVVLLTIVALSQLRRPLGHVLGLVVQAGLIVLAVLIPMMWIPVAAFVPMYVYGVFAGHRLDREKDEIDARAREDDDAAPVP